MNDYNLNLSFKFNVLNILRQYQVDFYSVWTLLDSK